MLDWWRGVGRDDGEGVGGLMLLGLVNPSGDDSLLGQISLIGVRIEIIYCLV